MGFVWVGVLRGGEEMGEYIVSVTVHGMGSAGEAGAMRVPSVGSGELGVPVWGWCV